MPGNQSVACVRDPAKAAAFAARGVQIRAADFAKPDSLATAFAGATQVLVVSVNQLGKAAHRKLAAIATELTGREIRRVVVPDEEWRDAKIAQGVPAPMADALPGMHRSARQGDFAPTGPTLETLFGRPTQTMRSVLAGILKPGIA